MVLAILYLYFFGFRAVVHLEAQLESPYPTFFKIYWADEGKVYAEKNSGKVRINPNRNSYQFLLTSLNGVSKLRIDPLEYPGALSISEVSISQLGYESVVLSSENNFQNLTSIKQAETPSHTENNLLLTTIGKDGQFELSVSPKRLSIFPIIHLINIGLIFLVVLISSRKLGFVFKDYLFVPVGLSIVLVFVFVMSAVTGLGVHPDERVHFEAVKYYGEHLLPPSVDDPEIASSYSGYGYTRLANPEVYYQLAGYFTRLVEPFHVTNLFSARLFSLLLLLGLCLFAFKQPAFRIFAMPLLISAQTWYLFSYTNSDAFAIFIVTIASYQIAHRESALNQFLTSYDPPKFWKHILIFGFLVGMLLLLKSNFYFFILFAGLYLIWRIALGDFPDQKKLWTRLALIGLVGISIFGGRIALDYSANGPNPGALKNEMAEKYADHLYKPSTPLDKKHIYLYLKDRNFSLDRILNKEKWAGKTFLNAFGIIKMNFSIK